MITLNEGLLKNIETIIRSVRAIERLPEKSGELSADEKQRLSLRCAELSLLSLAASDELGEDGPPAERMIRHELTTALRHIALQGLNVQEWESAPNIMAYIAEISGRCDFIAGLLKLPGEQQILALDHPVSEMPTLVREAEPQEERLRGEIQALREILTALVLERDKLLHSTCKELEAAYMKELGAIEAEIYRAECEIRYLRRKMEMMRAALNRREPIQTAKIEETLQDQFREFQRAYEEFKQRVENAESAQKKKKAEEKKPANEDENEEQHIKKLYRKIVKAMHPDIHPHQSEEEKALFKRANQAYEAGDYKTLHEIAATLDGMDTSDDRAEELLREKERILTLIRSIRAEIHLIKTRYPYTKKEIFESPEKLSAEKARLNAKLDAARKQIEAYRKHISEMEQHGRPDASGE